MVEAGNVYLPHPMLVPWVEAFLEETAAFPNGRHDDQVDAMTQALKTGFGRAAGYSISRNRRFSSIRLRSQRSGREPLEWRFNRVAWQGYGAHVTLAGRFTGMRNTRCPTPNHPRTRVP